MTIQEFFTDSINSCIEILFYGIIVFSLLQKRILPKWHQTATCLLLILINTAIAIPIKNQIAFTAVSTLIIYFITLILSKESIIHSVYLFMITYCITLIIQLMLVIPFGFLLKNPENPVIMLTGNLLTLLSVIIVCRFVPIHILYDFVLEKDFYFRLILCNTLISIILIVCLYRIRLSKMILLFPIIAVYLIFVVIFNIILINSKNKLFIQQGIINSYHDYLPVVEELIREVRERQHQYKNDLASLNSLTLTCGDYETLCSELSKNIELLSVDSSPSFLLSFNLKLMSGFLYSQYIKATNQGIHMSFQIRNYNIKTDLPEYKLTQAIGILIDNAVEASDRNDTIFVEIDCVDHRFLFSTSNPGPVITPDFAANLFKEGYSTKRKNSNDRGIGLHTLKKMMKQNKGTIQVANEERLERTYIKFTIAV